MLNKITCITLIIFLAATSYGNQPVKQKTTSQDTSVKELKNGKKKVKLPVYANLGIGYAQYVLPNIYPETVDQGNGLIGGTELRLYAEVDQEGLKKLRDKVPEKHRKLFDKIGGISITPSILIPRSIFIAPRNENREAYGATWAFGLGISPAWKNLAIKLYGGLALSYIYYRDNRFADDSKHFIRPGLTGTASIHLFPKNTVSLDIGYRADTYLSQEMFGTTDNRSLNGFFANLVFRYKSIQEVEL
ncbi:MAG: hypothetical protein AB8E15_11075 [Bdellovibrionales bacterium]